MEVYKQPLYGDNWIQELPPDVYSAYTHRRKVHLFSNGASAEGNAEAIASASFNRKIVEAGVLAGFAPESVPLQTRDFIKAPDQIEVHDITEFRRLVRYCYRMIPDRGDKQPENEAVERIMAHEQAHYDVGSKVATLTPHFIVTFIEDINTQKVWLRPAIVWSGLCTAQEYDAIQKAPEHLSQSDSLSERIIGDLA